jgi:L-fuculose-phosphate aldolase
VTGNDHRRAANALVAAGARLAEAGLVLPGEGNLSARLDGESFLVTPAGADKGRLRAVDLLTVSVDDGVIPPGASSDAATHRMIYRRRPEVGAVVHAHPPWVLALSARDEVPDISLVDEGRRFLSSVAGVGSPREPAVPGGNLVASALADRNAGVLFRHGAITVAETVDLALFRMLLLERLAELTWIRP